MAVQAAVPSHGGEKMVSFIKDADEKYFAPVSNFLGLKCTTAGRFDMFFEKDDGDLDVNTITINCNDDDGKGMKRAIEAIAISMGAPTRIGAYLKISDALTGEHIHPDILSVQAVS